ncbi:MAG: error-prone DNA polymerase [Spongiibacteraceae bacterium]|jgi:error-prone DNA polymerase|nr:error-prone DNA polymerase [Spongiibacteraceae bacterium]
MSAAENLLPHYAELHCLSNFSFLQGASHPQELVLQAAALGYSALAVTDECSLAGVVRAHAASKQCQGFKLIIGSEFRLEEGTTVVALVTNRTAYSELASLITLARRRAPKGQYRLHRDELGPNLRHCLLIWRPDYAHPDNDTHAERLREMFGERLWIGASQLLRGDDPERMAHCRQLAERWQIPLLACGDVRMHAPERELLQDALTAIYHNTSVAQLGYRRHGNAERYLRPLPILASLYPPAWLAETKRVADRCHFSLDELRYEYPPEVVPPGMTPASWLRHLVEEGARKRWPNGTPPAIQQQIENELALIAKMEYEYYFLTVWEIVDFARSHNILCQGRGSAANSVVCYCLFITEVSPERATLLFERFISEERREPPDIDVDFEHERREEVIQHIYKKYTRERAALVATLICYRPRSAIRDIGKALGLDPVFVTQLTESLAWWDRREELINRFKAHGLHGDTALAEHFFRLVQEILGFPRHLSQHVGGFLISKSPISTLVPVENAAMEDRTVIQWDKDDIEELRLLKVDVLALGMLSAIQKCLQLIERHHGRALTMQDIPSGDTATYDMLCRADSVGVFQVESRAQMAMLPRLKPRNYYDLVVQVAIVRPGPIQGDMVHPYLHNRTHNVAITYPNDEVRAVLERTHGVPIFQEQVIKLAMVAAGFSAGEADQLRRSMASWGKNGTLNQFQQKLIDGMRNNGYSEEFAQRLFRQMQGFGAYGFPESHAASFALLVYVSAWLKCHYPAAFYCALLNSQPMGFYSPSQLVQDARRHDIEVRPIDVRHSAWDHTLEGSREQPVLRLGMRLIKGFSRASAERLQAARDQRPWRDIADLQRRAALDSEQLGCLIAANALQGLSGHRHQARWQALAIPTLTALEETQLQQSATSDPIDYDDEVTLTAPSEAESLRADYNTTSLTLGRHPLAILRELRPEFRRYRSASEVQQLNSGRFVRIAGIVTGRQRPGTASGVVFLTIEDETGNHNVVVWRDVQERCRQALLNARLLVIKGVVERDETGSVVHVIAGELIDRTESLPDVQLKSRDFH